MNFRKSILGLTACVALAGLFAWSSTIQARPFPAGQDADIRISLPGGSSVNTAAGPICETTGFEPSEGACTTDTGFMCGGAFVGICFDPPQVCTGDNSTDQNCCIDNRSPSGWYMSITSKQCEEPHIDTINPAMGTQHMRFSRDDLGGSPPGCTGFGGACRQSAFTPDKVGPLPIGRTVIEFDVAMGDPTPGAAPFGASGVFWGVADNEIGSSGLSLIITFDEQGAIFVNDIPAEATVGVGLLTGNGAYDHFKIDNDPCTNTVTYTMTDASGGFIGSHSHDFTGLEKTFERGIYLFDNAGFFWDIDNHSVVRTEACPSQCGDDVVQSFLGEQCDGTDSALCPGLCRPAGDPDGECTCIVPCEFCEGDCELVSGSNGPFLTHGGFFTYTPEGPFTGIDTCGSDYDSALFIGDPNDFCTGGSAFINDDCASFGAFGDQFICNDGNHGPENCWPGASCFGIFPDTNTPQSCICVETVAGTPIVVWAAGFPGVTPPPGSNMFVTLTNADFCGAGECSDGLGTVCASDGNCPSGETCDGLAAPIPNGACCNGLDGTCADNVAAEDCAGPSDTYFDNQLCSFPGAACAQDTGGCCDASPGLGGQCTAGVLPQDCTGALQSFSKLDDTCGGDCTEIEGACCDGLTGNCFESIQGDCPESSQTTWALGAACGDISCVAATGACCDTGTNDPTVSNCTPTTQAACDCAKCGWTKGASCSEISCLPNFQTIPTVSEWGLVVLTLLLLVGGKIYFGRREAALS